MSPLRAGIVGYGFIAEHGHVPAYRGANGAFEIVAIADGCRERLEAAHTALPHARLYRSHEAMLDAERGHLDFVDVTAPPCDHAAITHAALDRGLHVLCEKPLATRWEDGRAMLEHARAARRVIYPCHNYKHAPVIRSVNRLLAAGAIGQVRLATLDTFRTTHARGVDAWRPDWRRDLAVGGGGIAMDHGPHTFYLAMSWMRAAPTSISARMTTFDHRDTEDTVACTIAFPTGVATATLSWIAGARKVIYTLHGDRGAIRVEDDTIEVTLRERPQRRVVHRAASDWMDAGHSGWIASMLEHFVAAIDAKDFAGAEAHDALRSLELIAAAYASSRNGGREVALASPARDEVPLEERAS